MLQIINQRLEKMMPIITPASVVIGVFFSDHLNHFTYLVPWIFAFITFSGSLSSSFKSLQRAFLFLDFSCLSIVSFV